MRIRISTPVQSSLKEVKEGFTKSLFLKLNPPFPPVKLLRFDGCRKGDQVQLQLNFLLFKQRWISEIVEDTDSQEQWYFVDVGTVLPFFLKSWKHRHVVRKAGSGSVIIDDIEFSTGTLLTNILFYPLLWGQFLYRKPVYKRIFSD